MPCPRCGEFSMRIELITEEDRIEAERCLLCGWIFDEPVLDHHHGLASPPPPRPDVLTPIWDPEGSRLKIIQRLRGLEKSRAQQDAAGVPCGEMVKIEKPGTFRRRAF